MNERIAFAAMAILLAAHLLSATRSPETVALEGTYIASAGHGAETYLLTLGADLSATLATVPEGGAGESSTETGAWILEGSSVHVAFAGDTNSGGATAVTLELRDGALVAEPGDEAAARFAGLTFTRSEPQPTGARTTEGEETSWNRK
jgi:hypothetical protein